MEWKGKRIWEYLNGKRNGKCKEYNYNGKLIFEGEYLKGEEMEKEKNIILMVKPNTKVII